MLRHYQTGYVIRQLRRLSMKKKIKLRPEFRSITIWCPELEREVVLTNVDIYSQGCMGHPEDGYCYCSFEKYLEVYGCECKDGKGYHEVNTDWSN
jgi:hypothetical protein